MLEFGNSTYPKARKDYSCDLCGHLINCSTDISTNKSDTSTISKMENVGWIPCERELPKKGQMCLCSVNTEKYKAQHPIVICVYREPYINRWADWYTAWMPLPAPYTEGE